MASSWSTAVGLIVIIAVFTFGLSANSYVASFVTYFIGLMNFKFVESLVLDLLVVCVEWFLRIVCPGVFSRAQLRPGDNPVIAPNTDAVPDAPATPAVSAAPVGMQHMAPGSVPPGDIIENIEVMPFPCGPGVPAMAAPAARTVPAMAAPAAQAPETAQNLVARMKVEQNARKAALEAARANRTL